MPQEFNTPMHNLQFYLDEFAKDDLIYLFLPIFLLALTIELIVDRKYKLQLFDKKDTIASLWMMLFVVFTDVLPKLLALVAFYWMHRANHEVRIFWAGHVSHHSAIKMNFATALRQGVMERVHKYRITPYT